MLDRLSAEILFDIHSYLLPHCQLNLALCNKTLWIQSSSLVQQHKTLARECAAIAAQDFNVFTLFNLWQAKPRIALFVQRLRCCPKRREFPVIIDHIEQDLSRDGNRGFGILKDHLETDHVLRQLRNCEPLEVLAYILPALPSLRILEFTAPHATSGFLPNVMSWTSSLQQLSFLRICGEGPYPSVHISWLHLALTIPSLQTFHGHWIGMDFDASVALDWSLTLKLIGPSNMKSLYLTRSTLKAWEFAVGHIQSLETFMYNHVELRDTISGHNPAAIVARLPNSLKNLAILESHIESPRERWGENLWGQQKLEKVKQIPVLPFRQLQVLWCCWAVLVPEDCHDFDLSRVLPWSLNWLALYCISTDEVDVLIASISKLPRLKKLWAQLHRLCGTEHITRKEDQDVSACMQRLQREMDICHVAWSEPSTSTSPFHPYLEYLDVHH